MTVPGTFIPLSDEHFNTDRTQRGSVAATRSVSMTIGADGPLLDGTLLNAIETLKNHRERCTGTPVPRELNSKQIRQMLWKVMKLHKNT